jgi:hypothetical protein
MCVECVACEFLWFCLVSPGVQLFAFELGRCAGSAIRFRRGFAHRRLQPASHDHSPRTAHAGLQAGLSPKLLGRHRPIEVQDPKRGRTLPEYALSRTTMPAQLQLITTPLTQALANKDYVERMLAKYDKEVRDGVEKANRLAPQPNQRWSRSQLPQRQLQKRCMQNSQ